MEVQSLLAAIEAIEDDVASVSIDALQHAAQISPYITERTLGPDIEPLKENLKEEVHPNENVITSTPLKTQTKQPATDVPLIISPLNVSSLQHIDVKTLVNTVRSRDVEAQRRLCVRKSVLSLQHKYEELLIKRTEQKEIELQAAHDESLVRMQKNEETIRLKAEAKAEQEMQLASNQLDDLLTRTNRQLISIFCQGIVQYQRRFRMHYETISKMRSQDVKPESLNKMKQLVQMFDQLIIKIKSNGCGLAELQVAEKLCLTLESIEQTVLRDLQLAEEEAEEEQRKNKEKQEQLAQQQQEQQTAVQQPQQQQPQQQVVQPQPSVAQPQEQVVQPQQQVVQPQQQVVQPQQKVVQPQQQVVQPQPSVAQPQPLVAQQQQPPVAQQQQPPVAQQQQPPVAQQQQPPVAQQQQPPVAQQQPQAAPQIALQPGTIPPSLLVSEERFRFYNYITEFYHEKVERVKPLQADDNFKKFRFAIQKAINIPVNAISAFSPQHLRDKFEKLYSLIAGQIIKNPDGQFCINEHPLGRDYCLLLMAKKFVNQGDTVISSNPQAAFPVASIIVSLWKSVPDFDKIFLAYTFKESPFLVPYFIPQMAGQSMDDYIKILGYRITDNKPEPQDMFLKRQAGIARLYAAVMVTGSAAQLDVVPHPYGIENAWRWMTNFVAMEPLADICATILQEILQNAGFELWRSYGKQFVKLLLYLQQQYFPKLSAVDTGGPKARLELLLNKYLKEGQIPQPQGMLPKHFW